MTKRSKLRILECTSDLPNATFRFSGPDVPDDDEDEGEETKKKNQ